MSRHEIIAHPAVAERYAALTQRCSGSGLPPAAITQTSPYGSRKHVGTPVATHGTCQTCGREFSLTRRGTRFGVVRVHDAKLESNV